MADYLHALRRLGRKRHTDRHTDLHGSSGAARHARGGADQRVAVIGLGRFGESLAYELMRRGRDVLGVDTDPRIVQRHSEALTHAVVADCTDPEALRQLGVHEFTSAVIGIGSAIEASILVTSNLLDAKVPDIWAKAITRQHGQILGRLGVHHVVLPEHEMGERVAHLVTGGMLDFIEFDDDYALVKTVAPEQVTGLPLGRSLVRSTFGVTVVGIKRPGEDFTYATADTVVERGDVIVVTGRIDAVEVFATLP
ncbi:TrkA family potassium uptake protein [Streptomyces sp. MZ04]|uniref:potassium channel family protein n=1 Tax=Streptomyces sp. MZ04 TaxID=2559236 RepID=UPI00107EC123|nr:TrkA family potassium uptake protein [Streptomyces sp. MZ04]TGB07533.1 TrkA family potassium uptake protein [Streptomyces sp. MZ04]